MRPPAEIGMLRGMQAMHIFQILNHYTSKEDLDPGFGVLDNSANERPDWYEYWPIRNFLLAGPLDENAFYGFLSPKFRHKTNLTAAAVRDIIVNTDPATDVVLFSPSIHNSAYFLSVFEHGENEHTGLLETAQQLFARIGKPTDLKSFISDSRNTVHSNYFVAKPRFWRAWLEVAEQMYAFAEQRSDALGRALSSPTSYRGANSVHMKIFVMERIATWLLARDASFIAKARDPFAARSRFYKLPVALICDALKIAYVTQARSQYKDVFLMVRNTRKILNLQVRLGAWLSRGAIRTCVLNLKAYWQSSIHD